MMNITTNDTLPYRPSCNFIYPLIMLHYPNSSCLEALRMLSWMNRTGLTFNASTRKIERPSNHSEIEDEIGACHRPTAGCRG
jgi:hypothetical protein